MVISTVLPATLLFFEVVGGELADLVDRILHFIATVL